MKSKVRTVLPEIKSSEESPAGKEETPVDDKASSEAQSSSDTEEKANEKKRELEAEVKAVEPRKLSKRQKRKALDADNENLESEYYSKLLDEGEKEKEKEDTTEAKSSEENVETESRNVAATASKKDLKEEELLKAERTIFVGNVPVEVVTSKALNKQFKKLFAIKKKSEDNTEDETEDSAAETFFVESVRFRSISFEEALPRKVAFVQQKLHKSRDSANAYVVYADKAAVKIACEQLNGTLFQNHHLRVDSVTHPTQHDNKRSVFVGNLDFEETEENLWKHFGKSGDIEYVRLIRDSKTNMGKGFAYVQFRDFQTVNKALLLDGQKLNGTGRKLRVTRCKNMKKTHSSAQKHSKALSDQQRTKLAWKSKEGAW